MSRYTIPVVVENDQVVPRILLDLFSYGDSLTVISQVKLCVLQNTVHVLNKFI
jgi:hypothetical protein